MNTLLTDTALHLGMGRSISRQKKQFTHSEQVKIKQGQEFYEQILALVNIGYLNNNQLKELRDALAEIALGSKPFHMLSIFCPSYKKGRHAYGYNKEIGSKTRQNLQILTTIQELCKKYNVECSFTVFFSDLLLENYEKIKTDDYLPDLDDNFDDLRRKAPTDFHIFRLSDINALNNQVGIHGAKKKLCEINALDLDIVKRRNQIAYKEILGWADAVSDVRTAQLAISDPYLSQAMNVYNPAAIYYWSESAIERTRLMPNLELPLFVPKC